MSTGRGGNATNGRGRDTATARINGGGLATIQGACPRQNDLLEWGAAGGPGDCCAGKGIRSWRFTKTASTPDLRIEDTVRAAAKKDGQVTKKNLARLTGSRRAYEIGPLSSSTFRMLMCYPAG